MALKLYTHGSTNIATTPNVDVPTNPKATTDADSAPSLSGALFTAIYPDDTTTDTIEKIISTSSLETEYSNLTATKGFRIKCYDNMSQTGIRLNSLDIVNDSFEYYVLLHSDNHLKHHFAKITEIIKSDVTGDSFDFTPKLGDEIAKDVKFTLCKLPKASTAIAFSAGLSLSLRQELIVSRPHYYFRGTVDKPNELDHNTKYFIRVRSGTGASIVLDNTSNTLRTTFLTIQDYNLGLIDYSKYSLKVKMVDNLRTLDIEGQITFTGGVTNLSASVTGVSSIDCTTALYVGMALTGTSIPANTHVLSIQDANTFTMSNNATGTGTRTFTTYNSNEGQTNNQPLNYEDYEFSFPNARRDGDDLLLPINNFTSTGPLRYLHYDFSPDKCNKAPNVIDNTIYESIGGRGAYNECKIVDAFRIMPKKIKEFDAFRVRNRLLREVAEEFVSFDWTITNLATATITVDSSAANVHFVVGNEIKIGNYICIVKALTTNTITLESYYKLESESQFTAGTPPITVDDTIYRRRLNPYNNTILTDFPIINDRTGELYVVFIDENFVEHYASVTLVNSAEKLLTITLSNSAYTTNQTKFISGNYYIECEKFNGEIETINTYKENSQTFMELKGRNAFNKLLSPIINKNTLFSSDIIYSSETPYPELERLKGTGSVDAYVASQYDSTSILFRNASNSSLSTAVSAGDKIFVKSESGNIKYVGTIASNSTGSTGTLEAKANTYTYTGTTPNNSTLPVYKQKKKEYVFNKALSSNPYVSSTTHLTGASNKGVFFNGGKTIVGGVEGNNLVGASYNPHPAALGFHISNVKNMKSDSYFQATLGDDADTEAYQTFDTVNTLLDFSIINIHKSGANKSVELAAHIPLTLARINHNYANTQDITNVITYASAALGTVGSVQDDRKILTTGTGFCSTTTDALRLHGKPVYVSTVGNTDYVFVGKILFVSFTVSTAIIAFDRDLTSHVTAGQQLSILEPIAPISGNGYTTALNKLSHELNIINGGHLHTGKIISMLHPAYGSDNQPKNFEIILNNLSHHLDTTTFYKYGESQYRIFNLEKGVVRRKKQGLLNLISKSKDAIAKQNTISYYGSAYRFGAYRYESSAFDEGLLPIDKITSYDGGLPLNNLPIELRGEKPSSGSRFYDSDIFSLTESNVNIYFPYLKSTDVGYDEADANYINVQPFTIKEYLELIDPSVGRMFLFSNSDITPYSKNKKTSLLYGTRSIQDYTIVGLEKPFSAGRADIKDDSILTESLNLNDDSYSSSNIFSADKTLSALKGFSMMRLTEVCLDWAFNQINPEMPIDRKATIPKINALGLEYSSIGPVNTAVSTTAQYEHGGVDTKILSDGNANWETADSSGNSLVANDMICDGNGRYIGTVSGFSNHGGHTSNLLDLRKIPYKTNGNQYYTGNIYKVRKADVDAPAIITGRGDKDSFIAVDDNIHMLKSIFMSRAKHRLKRNRIEISYFNDNISDAVVTGASGWYLIITLPREDGTNAGFFIYPVDGGSAIPSAHSASYSGHTPIAWDITGYTAASVANKINRLIALKEALAANATFTSYLFAGPSHLVAGNAALPSNNLIQFHTRAVNSSNPSMLDRTGWPHNHLTSSDANGDYEETHTVNRGHKIGYGQNGTASFTDSDIINDAVFITNTGTGAYKWSNGEGYDSNRDSGWREQTGQTLGGNIYHGSYTMHSALPIVSNINSIGTYYPMSIFRWLANLPKNNDRATSHGLNMRTHKWESLYKFFNIVSLDRFDIEDNNGDAQAKAGISSPFIRGIFRKEYTNSGTSADDLNKALYGINMFNGSFIELALEESNAWDKPDQVGYYMCNPQEFAQREFEGGDSNGYNRELREADGALIAFKPKLFVPTSVKGAEITKDGLGDKDIYIYKFVSNNYRGKTNISPNEYTWLNFIDLTGCYLVSSRGKKYNTKGFGNAAHLDSTSIADRPSQYSADGLTPETVAYVLSHHIDTTEAANTHRIITDKQLKAEELYRILQPNHTFSYSFSPKQIRLNELSGKYTKLSNENKTYTDILNWQVQSNSIDNEGELEGVLSMYVIVDVDNQTDSESLVIRHPDNLAHNNNAILDIPETMVISDSENAYKLEVDSQVVNDGIGYYLSFSESKDLKGVVSLTEPFTVSVGQDFNDSSKRCIIGSGVNICNESEDLLNNLLQEENINFTLDDIDYPLFMSPDFQGIDLLTAVNFILQKKNKSLIYENGSFSIKDKESSDFYSNVFINDSGDFQILEFEKVKTTFDLHNEIIVYGNSHKAKRKNLRSINKVGRKTLEVFERELITQDVVDKRAKELLKLHSTINTKLVLTLSSKGLGQLRAGDIVQVQVERENIERAEYIVLQIEHMLSGVLKLQLGRFSKELEDRFAELLISNKKTNSAIRNQKFPEKTIDYDFFETMKLKELRLFIRKREAEGGNTLGFGTSLNTGTNPLGFGGGTVTLTTLVDEDLA